MLHLLQKAARCSEPPFVPQPRFKGKRMREGVYEFRMAQRGILSRVCDSSGHLALETVLGIGVARRWTLRFIY